MVQVKYVAQRNVTFSSCSSEFYTVLWGFSFIDVVRRNFLLNLVGFCIMSRGFGAILHTCL